MDPDVLMATGSCPLVVAVVEDDPGRIVFQDEEDAVDVDEEDAVTPKTDNELWAYRDESVSLGPR